MITPLPTTFPLGPTAPRRRKATVLEKNSIKIPAQLKRQKCKRLGYADTPLQVATALSVAKEDASKPGKSYHSSYVCFLQGTSIIGIEPLPSHRSYNPKINVAAVIQQASKRYPSAHGVVLATWHQPGSERPWSMEQDEEIVRQYTELRAAGLFLTDHLRISATGTYSYYASTAGPFHYAHDPAQAVTLKCLY